MSDLSCSLNRRTAVYVGFIDGETEAVTLTALI